MARRKTITRDHILNAAYEVVSTEGFTGFTARNIASKMKSSTQPIYLEFKNMDDLRNAFFDKVEEYLRDSVFDKEVSGDPIIDVVINFVEFAKNNKTFFRALFIEDHVGGEKVNQFSIDIFYSKIEGHDVYDNLSDTQKETLFTSIWILATGLSSLAASERIYPTEAEIVAITKLTLKSLKNNPNFTITRK